MRGRSAGNAGFFMVLRNGTGTGIGSASGRRPFRRSNDAAELVFPWRSGNGRRDFFPYFRNLSWLLAKSSSAVYGVVFVQRSRTMLHYARAYDWQGLSKEEASLSCICFAAGDFNYRPLNSQFQWYGSRLVPEDGRMKI